MTVEFQFLGLKPLSKKTTGAASTSMVILNVMKHNLREIQAEFGARADSKIDVTRIADNVVLYGLATAADVALAAANVMRNLGVAVRKNAAVGIEVIVSLPANTTIDCNAYFKAAADWLQGHFNVPILSAVIHYDERFPHIHVVLLPIRDGKLATTAILGGRPETRALHRNFNDQVSRHYGLRLAPPKKRHSAAACQEALDAAFLVLEANSGLDARFLRTLLAPHLANPEPLLTALGLTMPAPKVKGSFVATMTKPCATNKSPIGHFPRKSPIGHFSGPKTKSPMLC